MQRDESPVNRLTGERSTTSHGEDYPEKLAAILASDCGAYWAEHSKAIEPVSETGNATAAADDSSPPPDLIFKLQDGIELLDRCIGMHHIVVLNDKRVGKFYHLGGHEADVLSLMDGQLSVKQIADALQRDGIQWTAEEIQCWALMLAKSGLAISVDRSGNPISVDGSPPSSSAPGDQAAGNPPTKPGANAGFQKAIRPFGHVISQRISIASADRVAAWILPFVGRLFTYSAVLVWSIAAGVSLGFAWTHSTSLGDELRMMFSPAALPLLAVIWVLLKAIHEIGHAVAAKRKGVRVGKFGITFFLFAPIPYVDVTDAWRLSRVWSRVQIAFAGVYLEGWTAIIATGIYVMSPEGLGKHLAGVQSHNVDIKSL